MLHECSWKSGLKMEMCCTGKACGWVAVLQTLEHSRALKPVLPAFLFLRFLVICLSCINCHVLLRFCSCFCFFWRHAEACIILPLCLAAVTTFILTIIIKNITERKDKNWFAADTWCTNATEELLDCRTFLLTTIPFLPGAFHCYRWSRK